MAPLNDRQVQATGDGVWFYHGNIASPFPEVLFSNS
jgi:hypothetical protein